MIKRSRATQLTFWMDNEATFNEQEESGIEHVCFFPIWAQDDTLADQFIDDDMPAGVSYKLQALNEEGDEIALINYSDLGSGIQQISAGNSFAFYGITVPARFKILRYVDAVLDEDFISPVTDIYNIQPTHSDSRLISYTNDKDFAGIVYTEGELIFNIRIKCRFYRKRNPTEEESESLSDGTVEKLSSSFKRQKRLDIDPVPPYMHDLILLAIQHTTVSINNSNYVKEESYDQKELNDKFPFESAEVWLTPVDDNFITNV